MSGSNSGSFCMENGSLSDLYDYEDPSSEAILSLSKQLSVPHDINTSRNNTTVVPSSSHSTNSSFFHTEVPRSPAAHDDSSSGSGSSSADAALVVPAKTPSKSPGKHMPVAYDAWHQQNTSRAVRKAASQQVSDDEDDADLNSPVTATAAATTATSTRPKRQAAKRVRFDEEDEEDEEEVENEENEDEDVDEEPRAAAAKRAAAAAAAAAAATSSSGRVTRGRRVVVQHDEDDDDDDDYFDEDDNSSVGGRRGGRGGRGGRRAAKNNSGGSGSRKADDGGDDDLADSDLDSDDEVRLSLTPKEQAALREQLRARLAELAKCNSQTRNLDASSRKKMRNRKASSVSRLKKKLAQAVLSDRMEVMTLQFKAADALAAHYRHEAEELFARLKRYEGNAQRLPVPATITAALHEANVANANLVATIHPHHAVPATPSASSTPAATPAPSAHLLHAPGTPANLAAQVPSTPARASPVHHTASTASRRLIKKSSATHVAPTPLTATSPQTFAFPTNKTCVCGDLKELSDRQTAQCNKCLAWCHLVCLKMPEDGPVATVVCTRCKA